MEPKNRPYVDPGTEPGDTGTEPWAGDPAESEPGDRTKHGSLADPIARPGDGAAIDGSPADEFLTEDVVSARSEDPDQPDT